MTQDLIAACGAAADRLEEDVEPAIGYEMGDDAFYRKAKEAVATAVSLLRAAAGEIERLNRALAETEGYPGIAHDFEVMRQRAESAEASDKESLGMYRRARDDRDRLRAELAAAHAEIQTLRSALDGTYI